MTETMTGRAADALGVAGVGRVEVGAAADLVLFDPASVIDQATYVDPRLPPIGIDRVWVAGRPVVTSGQLAADIPAADETIDPA